MKNEYETLKKKFNLPSLEELESTFNFETKNKKINEILDLIIDSISDNAKLLESLLFIDAGSPVSKLYEASMLKDKEIDIFSIYKELMSLFWQGKRVNLDGDIKQKADFIIKSYNKWRKFKQKILKVYEIFENEWLKVSFRDSGQVAYHG